MSDMHRNFRYRLFTNVNQDRELGTMLETHRRLYNALLDLRQMVWEFHGENFTLPSASRWFKSQRKTNPYYARTNFTSAQQTMRRLDRAFAAFFRRIEAGEKPGYPRFKGREKFDSFTFAYHTATGRANGIRLIGNRLRIQYVGTVRVKLHRPVEGTIKTATLKREAGKWYVIFCCETTDAPIASTLPAVGIDVGLESFLTTSEGESEPNPRYLKDALPELRRAGRSLARKKKGGSNRRKARRKLAKTHARVRNLRREHHHQVACRLTSRYGLIAAERLNIQKMLGNRRLARAIQDAAWGGFLSVLRCKAESAGARFVEVDCRGTSQECSQCGQVVSKDLSVRQHDCPHCGLSIHRDINAARNILARARQVRIAPAGDNVAH